MIAALGSAPPNPERERFQHVVQGEFAVVNVPGVVLTTLLGSCVATCMWDATAGVGGMNHFLLPGDSESSGDSVKYGVNAMELLVNGLLQKGASRARLQAKLFGGANVIQNLGEIGAKNAAFAIEFLRTEGVPCLGQSLGGAKARRIRFWPMTGRAGQLLLEPNAAEVVAVERSRRMPEPPAAAGSVELF